MKWISDKRIWVDDTTFNTLSYLFKATKGYINREKLCGAIICEWIKSEGNIKIGNIILNRDIQKIHCMWLVVDDDLWNTFKYMCYRNGIDLGSGFKIMVYRFVDLIDNDPEKLLGYFYE